MIDNLGPAFISERNAGRDHNLTAILYLVQALHKLGADPNALDYPFFLVAAGCGSPDMVKTIVTDLGVHPNSTNRIGSTMLIVASYGFHAETIQTLVDLGADVNLADNNGTREIPNPKIREMY